MMNKRIAILLAAVLLVLVAGCGKNAAEPGAAPKDSTGSTSNTTGGNAAATTGSGGNSTAAPTATATATPQKKTYSKVNLGPLKKGETAKVGPLSIAFTELAVTRQATGLPPGYAYASTMITIANEDELYTINTSDHFSVETPQAKLYKVNLNAMGLRTPKLQGSIDKGANTSGWLGFLVKVVDGTYKFTFTHPDYGTAVWEFTL